MYVLFTAGSYKSAGLPNITGDFTAHCLAYGGPVTNGAFYGETLSGKDTAAASYAGYPKFYFSASRSSSIYGNSSTVQPPAITVRFYIKY